MSQKISQLAAGTPAVGTDLMVVARGAANYSLTLAQVFAAGLTAIVANGSAAAPGLAFAGSSSSGFYRDASGILGISVGGTIAAGFQAGQGIILPSAAYLAFSVSGILADTLDTRLYRDGAGILSQRSGTTAQRNNVYYSYTDASNYQALQLDTDATTIYLRAVSAGTGAANININAVPKGTGALYVIGSTTYPFKIIPSGTNDGMRLGGGAAGGGSQIDGITYNEGAYAPLNLNGSVLNLASGANNRWQVNANGHFIAVADNTYDIGINGQKPRTVYCGTSLVTPLVSDARASIDLTVQAAAIGSTLLYNVPAADGGIYEISWVASVTRVATTSSILGGAAGFQLTYTDVDDSVVKTTPAAGAPGAGVNQSYSQTNQGNTTATQASGMVVVNAKASTAINYLFGYTSVGAQTMQFNLHIKIRKLA